MSDKKKVAVVTGAAGGIGRATVVELSRHCYSLAICDLDVEGLEETARLIGGYGERVLIRRVDVSIHQQQLDFAAACQETLGRVESQILVLATLLLSACTPAGPTFRAIDGFPADVNQKLERFMTGCRTESGRKVAVFDGDGTVMGQTPHYLADECMYMYAREHPEKKPELLHKMAKLRNVSIPYVRGRVDYLAGLSVTDLGRMGEKCFAQHYRIFEPVRDLIRLLMNHGFEVWVVTGSPQALYQQFLSRRLGIPITNIVGVRSVVRGGIVTDEIVSPVPQDHGKKEAIETFIQERPLFVAGNSRGDKEMIDYSRGLKMIVNPDEHIAPDQKQSIANYAKSRGWLIVRIRDVPDPGFPSISSKQYGIRINKTRDVR